MKYQFILTFDSILNIIDINPPFLPLEADTSVLQYIQLSSRSVSLLCCAIISVLIFQFCARIIIMCDMQKASLSYNACTSTYMPQW